MTRRDDSLALRLDISVTPSAGSHAYVSHIRERVEHVSFPSFIASALSQRESKGSTMRWVEPLIRRQLEIGTAELFWLKHLVFHSKL